MFSFEISKSTADKIRLATSIDDVKAALKGATVRSARVLYYDDNRIISGELADKHAVKSLATLEAWAVDVLETFQFKIRGELYVHVTEDLVLQPGVFVEGTQVKPLRFKTEFKAPGEGVMVSHYSNLLKVEEVASQVKVTAVPGKEFQEFSETLTKTDFKALKARADKVIKAIEAALVKIK